MQWKARGLVPRSRLALGLDRLRHALGRRPIPDALAYRAGEQVSRNQLKDWIDRQLFDLEIAKDEESLTILKAHGLEAARRMRR
jgi:hypothetical protein